MKILLDTNVFLWMNGGHPRLAGARSKLENDGTHLFVSAATAWEIGIKYKLDLPESAMTWVPTRIRAIRATGLPIGQAHGLAAGALPLLLGDPFDRMLVAQAQAFDMTIVTGDRKLDTYDVKTILV